MRLVENRWRFYRRFGYLLPILILIVVGTVWDSPAPQLRYIGTLVLIIPASAYLIAVGICSRSIRLPRVILPILLLITLRGIGLSHAPVPIYGAKSVLTAISLGVLLIAISISLRGSISADHLLNAIIIFALVQAGIEIWLALSWHLKWWAIDSMSLGAPPPYRGTGLFLQNPNGLAAYLNLVLPLAWVKGVRSSRYLKKLGWLVLFMILGLCSYITLSRGAWVSALAAITVSTILLIGPQMKLWWKSRRGRVSGRSLWKILMVGTCALLVLLILLPSFIQRIASGGRPSIAGSRFQVWGIGWKMFLDSPIQGGGTGAYLVNYARVAGGLSGGVSAHAHDLWLQLAAENGIAAVVLSAWVMIIVLRSLVGARGPRDDTKSMGATFAMFAGILTAIGVQALVDFIFDVPMYSLSVFFIILALGRRSTSASHLQIPGSIFALGSALGLGIIVLGFLTVSRGEMDYWRGITRKGKSGIPHRQDPICSAANSNPASPLFAFQCALEIDHASSNVNEPSQLNLALDYLNRGLSIDPYWHVNWANLSALQWSLSKRAEALKSISIATELAPDSGMPWLIRGYMQEASGRDEAASISYANAMTNNIWLTQSHFMRQTDLRDQERQKALWRISSEDECNPILLWTESDPQVLQGAEDEMRALAKTRPMSGRDYSILALAMLRIGNTAESKGYIQLAEFLGGGDPLIQYVAGKIAFESGDLNRSIDYWIQSIEGLKRSSVSNTYYYEAFRTYDLPDDLSTRLPRANISPDMVQDYRSLVQMLRSRGDDEEADKIESWLQSQVRLEIES